MSKPKGKRMQTIILRGRTESPIVLGREQHRLTAAQYDVIEVLLKAGEAGLSTGELDRQSKHGDACKILKRLARSSPEWRAVIVLPGRPCGRYHLRCFVG